MLRPQCPQVVWAEWAVCIKLTRNTISRKLNKNTKPLLIITSEAALILETFVEKYGGFMNKEWSEMNKTMQLQLKKKETFLSGTDTLLELRKELMTEILRFKTDLSSDDFYAIPYINAKGYHNKTIAYSLWHIFRIEDIVAHTLIADDEQIFFKGNYQKRINSPIITTGNELIKEEISEFSKKLSVEELYNYIVEVDSSTTQILKRLTHSHSKEKVSVEKRKRLEALSVVSKDESAYWLVDYWCNKDIKGLIQMPFSRHWIMHIEACLKIRDKLLSRK